ncbi:MAG: DUF4173 domain-containing protein [Tabrizicola sp.]
MATSWVIRGVPRSVKRDTWWMEATADDPRTPVPPRRLWDREGAGRRGAALIALVALADWLFFGQEIGLSLALFAAAVLAAVMLLSPGRERLRPAGLLLIAALPVMDFVQALSLAILGLGLIASLLWASGGTAELGRRALRLASDLPLRGIFDGIDLGHDLAKTGALHDHRQFLRAWAFPAGGALVLMALLIEANPILGDTAFRLSRLSISVEMVQRMLFWTGAALLIWPLIAPQRDTGFTRFHLPTVTGPSAGSVARGLVVFNAILAVQTLMDAAYLWGGAALPEGMTAAEYAHRGAYPLLVTALLAGAFALAARPFAAEDRRLRSLLMLWLAQNVALTLSALLQLDLYVDAFGLTYLRIHAAIWMVLVATGLTLTACQVWRGLPNRWLLVRSIGLGAGTLYACCFVNFAAIIATENLSRESFDGTYICDLGPAAAGAILASGKEVWVTGRFGNDRWRCPVTGPKISGWRDWGFRDWRVSRDLERLPTLEGRHEDPRRG